jgi:hypothetical protein
LVKRHRLLQRCWRAFGYQPLERENVGVVRTQYERHRLPFDDERSW